MEAYLLRFVSFMLLLYNKLLKINLKIADSQCIFKTITNRYVPEYITITAILTST
jgi:hypothetical protein